MAEIDIQTVRKTFVGSKQPAVNDIDLTVADTEFMVLLGPSRLRQDDAAADDRGAGIPG